MPQDPHAAELSQAERIDALCDEFESLWQKGEGPRLEAMLDKAGDASRWELFRALLSVEVELRFKAREKVTAGEYEGRFPEWKQAIREVFREIQKAARESRSKKTVAGTVSVSSPSAETSVVETVPGAVRPAAELPPSLARFEILEVLGAGAFGTVYKARDPKLERDVAIKVPKESMLKTLDDRQRFLREARAAANLSHPNICPVHEVCEVEGRDYIVMGFIQGKPLSALISTGKIQARQAAFCTYKLARAFQEAHENGILHRDIKPANIMINRKGEPIVMDFGLARLQRPGDAQITQSGQIMGSPAYMSPEQARGATAEIRAQSDVYSLGVVLYEMLSGKRPFVGTVTEVLGQILHVPAPPPSIHKSGIDPALEAICMKAMAKDPKDRYSSMKEFAEALSQYLKGSSAMTTRANAAVSTMDDDVGQETRMNEMFAALAAEQLSRTRRAVREAAQAGAKAARPSWQVILGAAGVLGLVVFLGIWFFARTGTVSVVIQIPIDVTDPALTFFLDSKPISAESLAAPIELKPGEHELLVNRDGKLFKKFRFKVGKEKEKVAVEDVTPPPPPGDPAPAIAPFDAKHASQYQTDWAKHLGVPVEFTNSLGMKFRLIPPGEFLMGAPPGEVEAALQAAGDNPELRKFIQSEAPQHKVILKRAMYLGIHEVTQKQYQDVMGVNPSQFTAKGHASQQVAGQDTSRFPVEFVSWNEAIEFCAKLSALEQFAPAPTRLQGGELIPPKGNGYRLPTEAEWEFACRAGTTTTFWSGDDEASLKLAGWFAANSNQRTHHVGELRANPFGLFDVHGNAWEWVQDWWSQDSYSQFAARPAVDPLGPTLPGERPMRVVRGGFLGYGPSYCRSAHRNTFDQNTRFHFIGFRVALSVDAVKKALSRPAGTLSDPAP